MNTRPNRHILRKTCRALSFLAALSSLPARGEPVELRLPDNVVATAEYRAGNPAKPAVILLHGFLQTRNFPTIDRLVEALSAEGYTVLAPTLTLGVPYRARSIPCEAIHTHSVFAGVTEIEAWVKWLKAKKARAIVLAGHSLGNVYNLAYLSSHPDSAVKKFIGISIVEGKLKAGEQARPGQVKKLREAVRKGDKQLLEEQFSFCQKFRAPPESLLSYMEWGPDKILTAIQNTKISITMIMGSQDDRLGANWIERLKNTRAKVIVIPGANHFMDGQYEFDMMDHFLAELEGS